MAYGNPVSSQYSLASGKGSRMLASFFLATMGLCYCSNHNRTILGTPYLSGPSEAKEKESVNFKCEMLTHTLNETLLMRLLKTGNQTKVLGESTALDGKVGIFHLVIEPFHNGILVCVARAQNGSSVEATVSNVHYLKVVEPVSGAQVVVPSGSAEVFEGQELELVCAISAGTDVSYEWLLNGRLISEPALLLSDNHLLISSATSEDSGTYRCIATNFFNGTVFSTGNSEVTITVKDAVSAPDISFTVSKEESGNYSAVVACHSTTGTPPVDFALYVGAESVANMTSEDRSATFRVPLVLDRYMGELRCRANNGGRAVHSQWLPLEVVAVGGPVTMRYDYDVGENFAVVGLRLYCRAAKGSRPRYQWFLNGTSLDGRGSFYYVVDRPGEPSVLLLSVGRSGAGTYHCEVSDSFDRGTAIRSSKRYLDKRVLNRLPVLVVAVVFGCFVAVILLLSVCCGLGVLFGRRHIGGNSPLSGLPAERPAAEHEDELDLSEYREHADSLGSAGGDESDQASEASSDEWAQIAEEKRTSQL